MFYRDVLPYESIVKYNLLESNLLRITQTLLGIRSVFRPYRQFDVIVGSEILVGSMMKGNGCLFYLTQLLQVEGSGGQGGWLTLD